MTETRESFLEDFRKITDEICGSVDIGGHSEAASNDLKDHIRSVLEYNVPGGKLTRGLTVLHAVQMLRPDLPQLDHNVKVLGWVCEIMQSFFLIADDVMDCSITRRGRPCWYKVKGVGIANAVNDTLLLYCIMLRLLETHFKESPVYSGLISLVFATTQRTVYGQYLDTNAQLEDATEIDISRYTMDRYRAIVVNKTAYYSFYLPVALGMTVAGITDEAAFLEAEKFCVALGEYFQVQDDYLDCYGAPETIGKIGTDIEERKCSWLCCQFLLLCTSEDKSEFTHIYGKKDPASVGRVKELYKKYELSQLYSTYEGEITNRMEGQIAEIKRENLATLFRKMLGMLYKRQK